jgi:hypothetical protein
VAHPWVKANEDAQLSVVDAPTVRRSDGKMRLERVAQCPSYLGVPRLASRARSQFVQYFFQTVHDRSSKLKKSFIKSISKV